MSYSTLHPRLIRTICAYSEHFNKPIIEYYDSDGDTSWQYTYEIEKYRSGRIHLSCEESGGGYIWFATRGNKILSTCDEFTEGAHRVDDISTMHGYLMTLNEDNAGDVVRDIVRAMTALHAGCTSTESDQ